MDDGRQYYGVYIETDGAPLEIETMPGLENGPRRPLLVYRLVSDFLLVHLFTGPKPKDVLEQLTAYTGRQGDISRVGFAMIHVKLVIIFVFGGVLVSFGSTVQSTQH